MGNTVDKRKDVADELSSQTSIAAVRVRADVQHGKTGTTLMPALKRRYTAHTVLTILFELRNR